MIEPVRETREEIEEQIRLYRKAEAIESKEEREAALNALGYEKFTQLKIIGHDTMMYPIYGEGVEEDWVYTRGMDAHEVSELRRHKMTKW